MNRKNFLKDTSLISLALLSQQAGIAELVLPYTPAKPKPLAITMWDFSWLERRWPGGDYEDWDKILDELVERGYNAVRIDAYPHLLAVDATKEWTLLPVWEHNDWGSPGLIKVRIQPSLTNFIAICKRKKIKVGLSTWYRQDADNTRLQTDTPQKMAANWLKVLELISAAGLLDTILYVDMCNEWPASVWTPFFKAPRKGHDWSTVDSVGWMQATLEIMHKQYPDIPFTFSFDHYQEGILQSKPATYLDLIEQHIWMASLNGGEFNNTVGIDWNGFSSGDTKRTVEKAEQLYKSKPAYWDDILVKAIQQFAYDAAAVQVPLITTECWSIVNYKDYPMLNWDWVKETCALGVTTAAATGQWVAIATSNFCGPQFKGMWNDVAWHKQMTGLIKNSKIATSLLDSKLVRRL